MDVFYRLWYVCSCICHFKGISGVDVWFYRFCFWRKDLLYIYNVYMYILKRTPIRAVCPLHQLLMMTMYKGLNALHAWLCRYRLSFHIHLNTADIIHDFLVWNETVFIDDSISTNAFPVNLWKPLSTLYSVEIYAQFSFLSYLAWLFFRYIY